MSKNTQKQNSTNSGVGIKKVTAREILDSRGNPTVEVEVTLSDDSFGRSGVPSGASTGSHEAVELRDGGKRYRGKGVLKAVENVNVEISKKIKGKDWTQESLDRFLIELDGTENKGRLGANAILGVSLAFAKAESQSRGIPLAKHFNTISKIKRPMIMPVPMMNILNGGAHASKSTDLQEFMIMPIGAKSLTQAVEWGSDVFYSLKGILAEKGFATTVGDEGGFAPSLKTNEEALELIVTAIKKAGYKPGSDISIAIDAAASEFYKDGIYELRSENKKLTGTELIAVYESWVKKYPIVSIEDPLHEDDWDGYVEITKKLGKKIQIVGDDFFVTNTERLSKGIEMKAANSILIKLNQIGTVTETIEAIKMATKAGYTSVISHRSGETEDAVIADFAVGLGTGQIKTGSLTRSDRVAKYNKLIRIEEYLGKKSVYPGKNCFKI